MGIPNSKVVTDTKSDISLAEINTPSLTLSTPPKSIDPRSPSADIARTPIETIPSLLSIFSECNLVASKKEENDLGDNEINKTPVSIKQNSFKIDKDIRRKLLKDSALKIIEKTDKINALCDQIIESNTSEMVSDTSLTEMDTPSKFKTKVGLLETDIDYIETDIDQVYKKSHKLGLFYATPKDILHAKFKKQKGNNADMNNILELVDPRSPTVGIDRTPVQVIKPLDIDPRSPTIEFDRTPIQIPLKSYDYENTRSEEMIVDVENFELKLDTLCITDSEDEKYKSEESFEKVLSKEKSISEISLEKLVLPKRNLIYEDEECLTPTRKIQNVKQNEGNGRTPLGVRNGNSSHSRSKSANGRLLSDQKINKNDLKNAYAVSKIPVFNKNMKKIRGKVQQCENTPPTNLNDMKLSKRAQWDSADSTMII